MPTMIGYDADVISVSSGNYRCKTMQIDNYVIMYKNGVASGQSICIYTLEEKMPNSYMFDLQEEHSWVMPGKKKDTSFESLSWTTGAKIEPTSNRSLS